METVSRMDELHSALLRRVLAVIRDVWVEVEATVKDYQEETACTRRENAELKQQLMDVLSRKDLVGQVNYVSQACSEKVCSEELSISALEPAIRVDPQTEIPDPESGSGVVPSACKTEAAVELENQEGRSIPPAPDPAQSEKIKNEPEDTIITIRSSVTTAPAGAAQCSDPQAPHQLRPSADCSSARRMQRNEHFRTWYTKTRRSDFSHQGPYSCNKCGRQLKDLAKLQLHKKLHDRSFICHWCGRTFLKFDYLRMHMRVHTGERPYCCKWCSKTFSQSGNMRRHERTCQRFSLQPPEETQMSV